MFPTESLVRTRLISPATNISGETKARMLRACFVQTTMAHKSRGDMKMIHISNVRVTRVFI